MDRIKSNKLLIYLTLAALLVIFTVGVGVTYSWIEGGTTYSIQTENSDDVKTGTIDTTFDDSTILLSAGSTAQVSLLDYDKTTSDYQTLMFTPVSSPNGETFFLPNYSSGGTTVSYRAATTNDIGTKFINYEFKVKAAEKCYLAFNGTPSVSASDGTPFRFMVKYTDSSGNVERHIFSGVSTESVSSVVATDLNGGTTTLATEISTGFQYNSTTTKNRLFEFAKGETGTIEVSVWLDNATSTAKNYGTAVTTNINFIVGTPKYKFGINAVTQDADGNAVTNGFTGGTVKYGTSTYSAAQSSLYCVEGETVTLTATPKDGYEFLGWYKSSTISSTNLLSTSAEYKPTPTEGSTYYAAFKERSTSITTIYVEPRNYSAYYIYAYGNLQNEAVPTGYTRVTVDVSSFSGYSNYYLYMWDTSANDAKILGDWSGTKLTNKDADGNYYIDIANSKLTAGHNYYGIVNNGSGTQTADIPLTGLTIGYNHIIDSSSFQISQSSTKYAGEWNGTLTTYDSTTGYYKMTFETEDTGTFYAILSESESSTNRYPASGVDGLQGELGGTYLFTADNKLIEFDPSTMYTFKVQSSSSTAGSVYINSSGTTSMKLRPDQSVKIVATAATGYEFTGWYSSTTYANLISSDASVTVTPAGTAGSTVTYYAKFTQVSTTDYYIDSSAVSYFEQDGAVLAYSTNDGSSYTQATKVTYNGVSYWKVSVPIGTSSFQICRYISASAIYNKLDVTVSGTTTNNLYILNSGYTGGCWVHYEVGKRLVFFDASACSWFTGDDAVAGISTSGTSSSNFNYSTSVTYGGKTYYYFNLPSGTTSFYVGRKLPNGNVYNYFSVSVSGTYDLYTINSNSNGGSWSYFLH